MRVLALIVSASLLTAGGLPGAQEQRDRLLGEWLEAVRTHDVGRWDAPAKALGAWSSADLRVVYEALRARTRFDSRAGRGRPDVNALLVSGAMLHTDIAILGAQRVITPAAGDKFVSLSNDGRDSGQQPIEPGWAFARALMDAAGPDPRANPIVKIWYRATIAHMARYALLGDAGPHLTQARELFPRDADVLFASGWLYESYAGPRTQAVAEETVAPRGYAVRFAIPSVGASLKEAEEFYTRTLRAVPGHVEARVRRGRVRSLRGNHKEAIADLRDAVTRASDPYVKYHALLFLGGACEAIDSIEEARVAYARAATLYALAQSPHLALSRLATRRGDMPAAQREMRQVLRLSPDAPDRGDPWWTYHMGSGRTVTALLAELRSAVAATREGS